MKILYVLKSLPDRFSGGIQTHTWKLSAQMIKMGHEVHILAAGGLRRGGTDYLNEGRHIHEIHYIPGRRFPFLPTLAEEYSFNKAAFKWLKAHYKEFDVVHLQGRSGLFFPGYQSEVPIVNTLHGLISIENHRAQRLSGFDPDARWHQKWASKWETNSLIRSDHLIVVSQEMSEQLRLAGHDMRRLAPKITQIYNGIDPAPPNNGIETDPNLLVFVGRLYRIKGIFPLIMAMKKVRPEIRLVMVGEGPDRKKLEQTIELYGLSDRITLTGSLSSEEVYNWIYRSAFVVAPSLHESHGIVLLEAMSCGKTVVATDIPGIRESIRHGGNGLMVRPNDPDDLAKAIHFFIDHPKDAMEMGEAGKLMVHDRFDWDKIARRTEQVYEMVTGLESMNVNWDKEVGIWH